ncbi:hypothetical protein OG905_23060 [Streptomyces sp. NBC_00322]|uniref:hypothetical protein n=1 Tax=Streptomyces sp. NBC_00322 TaxID=2975712 RepID=UPI002E2AB3E9|nr:hypothetical protein [Streptomyces sp. NBC_00322]
MHRELPSVVPWVRHLSDDEVRQFVQELAETAHTDVDVNVQADFHRVIAEWRATARILADPELTAQLMRPLPEDDL